MSASFSVKDEKGRVLIHGNRKGKLALSRYEDLSNEEIQILAETYCELTGSDIPETINFLKFQEDNEKFCS